MKRVIITPAELEQIQTTRMLTTPDNRQITIPSNIIEDLLTEKAATVWYRPPLSRHPTAILLVML